MNLAALLQRAARSRPENPALYTGTNLHMTYAQLGERVERLAGWMRREAGLQPGDRVAFAMSNCVEFQEILWAAWHAGLIAVPVNAKLHVSDFAYIFANSGARVAFATPDLADDLAGVVAGLDTCERLVVTGSADYRAATRAEPLAMEPRAADDLAWLFYTSGTTGRPKGAMLSHRSLMACIHGYVGDVDPVAEGDHWLHAAPMSHGGGLYGLPFVAACAAQVVPASGKFDPPEMMELLARFPRTSFFAAPTMVKRLIEHKAVRDGDTANLRTVVYGGGPMYLADAQAAYDLLGPKLAQIYGQGESPMTITVVGRAELQDAQHPRFADRLASTGRAFANVEVMVADADDRPLPAGELGEVCVRGDVVMSGYWANPEASAETLRNGWLHTGDVGVFDAYGYLSLKDRSKDMIISGGTNIYPREVEEVLLQHPAVLEVSVIGEPDEEWGENVVAFVVARAGAGANAETLDRYCIETMARFKRPKTYHFVESLPKNNYGKVLKTDLRALLAADKAV
ncbi:MAG: AMP-binding protein [Alphaproteobacteria bacterium]|nr:AMP-binding protein [Alphaproteobacteria bacterium]MCB9929019.1 AMP-binding protein [Alphaproteobacteria bacterium]